MYGIKKKKELYHHGILGQKWGIRRFQNPDGTLTPEGKKRYEAIDKAEKKAKRFQEYAREDVSNFQKKGSKRDIKIAEGQISRYKQIEDFFFTMKNRPIWEISKEEMKSVQDFIDSYFTNADYAYYYAEGKLRNYEEEYNRNFKKDFDSSLKEYTRIFGGV